MAAVLGGIWETLVSIGGHGIRFHLFKENLCGYGAIRPSLEVVVILFC